MKPNIQEYLNILGEIPDFLPKYLELNIMKRLKKVGKSTWFSVKKEYN